MIKDLKILHIVLDDKFTDAAIRSFEAIKHTNNSYWIFSNKISSNFSYIKTVNVNIQIRSTNITTETAEELELFDLVVLHSLGVQSTKLVTMASDRIVFLWIGMGFDYYDILQDGISELLLRETRRLKFGEILSGQFLRYQLNSVRRWLRYKESHKFKKLEIIPKISYFAPVLESEHSDLKQRLKGDFPKYLDWNYDVSGKVIDSDETLYEGTKNILLGNSADPTNNHIEALRLIQMLEVETGKVIVPFNYGGDDLYKNNFIKKVSQLKIADRVEILDKFLQFDIYVDILRSCPNVIMNHIRQQAGGNIALSLAMGARVFLNQKSPFYAFYKSKEAHIYSLEDIRNNPALLSARLSVDEINKNKAILKSEWSSQRITSKTQQLVLQVLNDQSTINR